jgi:hypothetical protein
MPRRPANVNQADAQRMIRAFQREKVAFRVTLQPNGAAIFDPATVTILTVAAGTDPGDASQPENSEDLRKLL